MKPGEALADARRQAGMTITQVSQQTRIRKKIITGIETDDYSACGGDFYARGHIRAIARVVGTDPEPLIQEYDTDRLGPLAEDVTDTFTPVRPPIWTPSDRQLPRDRRLGDDRRPPQNRWLAGAGAALLVLLVLIGFAGYHFLSGAHQSASTTSSSGHLVTRPHRPARVTPSPAARTTTPATLKATTLTPASATAYNPDGHADNSSAAALAIDDSATTAWHSDWYRTPNLGGLYPGTGLLVNMGAPVTITALRISLGSEVGANFQLRVGNTAALADLPVVASATDAGGVVHLRLAAPARGQYALIWFTGLPPAVSPAGTFQASVYSLRLAGQG